MFKHISLRLTLLFCVSTTVFAQPQRVTNLVSFAKTYGYVRYFYPSDEASAINWEHFLVYGSRIAEQAKNDEELIIVLADLFKPLAPQIVFNLDGSVPQIIPPEMNKADLMPVYWQHFGMGGLNSKVYKSKRVGRTLTVKKGAENSLMSPEQTLFSTSPKKEEVFSSQISEQIHLHMPLVVFGDAHHTYPIAADRAKILSTKIQNVQFNENAKYTQISDVIVLWNSIQHFYPYFDQIDDRWSRVLVNSLDALEKQLNFEQFEELMKQMVAAFQDGHGRLTNPWSNDLILPVLFDLVEEQIVVIKSLTPELEIGDVIVKIAGKEIKALFNYKASLVSGSPQWKRTKALRHLRMWQYDGNDVKIEFHRNGKQHMASVQLGKHFLLKDDVLSPITSLKSDIYYVDLDRASMGEISPVIQNIANAKGVIFDLRGYPNSNHKVISHLLSKPDTSDKWMKVPHIIYPDHKFTEWENYNWLLPVAKPHIEAKVVFLINAQAISYSESILSFIKHYKLATIVGESTAGANGNVNHIALPSGLGVVFTGMRVSKHDGTQHHLIGVKPDVEITRTLQAVKVGRDEYLEKALEIIEGTL